MALAQPPRKDVLMLEVPLMTLRAEQHKNGWMDVVPLARRRFRNISIAVL